MKLSDAPERGTLKFLVIGSAGNETPGVQDIFRQRSVLALAVIAAAQDVLPLLPPVTVRVTAIEWGHSPCHARRGSGGHRWSRFAECLGLRWESPSAQLLEPDA
jgi:hypothetical protein